jgi:hypothetical protein
MDAAAFADWLTLDARLRRAIKAKDQQRAAAEPTAEPAADPASDPADPTPDD